MNRTHTKEYVTLTSAELPNVFASQPWVNDKDMSRAYQYNSGHSHYKSQEHPTLYRFNNQAVTAVLIGDGHHRVADAFIRHLPIRLEVDVDFGEIDPRLLTNPGLAAQRFAKYGIEGIWPFATFMEKFMAKQTPLSAGYWSLHPTNLLQNLKR